tara:strand:+ start:5882 stop:8353 length:2472 start_codon:yes stop_codon:yes gene_type:complete
MSVPADRMLSGLNQNSITTPYSDRDLAGDPNDQVLQLASSGIPIDQITAMTGLPISIVQGIVGRNQEINMAGNAVGGIQNTGMDNSITAMAGGVSTPETENIEKDVATTLDNLGLDSEKEDNETSLYDRVTAASAMGTAMRDGEEITQDGANTYSTMEQIYKFHGLDPESQTEANEIYLDAFKNYLDTDDIKKFVPKPDEALPFLVAGAALINSGTNGDDWGTALSNAFMQYAVGSNKEKKAYRNAMASIDINQAKQIQGFAADLGLATAKQRNTLRQSLITAKKAPYAVPGQEGPAYLTDAELDMYPGATPYQKEIGAYSVMADDNKDGIPDASAGGVAMQLSKDQARSLSGKGFIVSPGHDMLLKKTLFNVDGQLKAFTEMQRNAWVENNPKKTITKVGAANSVAVQDIYTGEVSFQEQSNLIGGKGGGAKPGYENYVPVTDSQSVVVSPDGTFTMTKGQPSILSGFLTPREVSKKQNEVTANVRMIDTNTRNILRTASNIFGVLEEAEQSGSPIAFGAAGALTTVGKNIIDQVDQFGTVLRGGDRFDFYNDANGNGKRDEGESMNLSEFETQFGDQFASTGLGKYLEESGLGRKRINAMIFTLALQSAASDNQKGRDISDKDIERFLARSGAFATSPEEFRTLILDLSGEAIDKRDQYVDTLGDYDTTRILAPGEELKIKQARREGIMDYEPETIGFYDAIFDQNAREKWENIGISRDRPDENIASWRARTRKGATPRVVSPNYLAPVPTGGGERSGIGTSTIDDVYNDILNSNNPLNRLEFYRTKNPEAFNKAINPYLLQRLEDDPRLIEAIPQLGGTS